MSKVHYNAYMSNDQDADLFPFLSQYESMMSRSSVSESYQESYHESDPIVVNMLAGGGASSTRQRCAYLCQGKPLAAIAVVTLCVGLLASFAVAGVHKGKTSDGLDEGAAVQVLSVSNNQDDDGPPTLRQRAERLMDKTPMIDGHNDLAYFLREVVQNHLYTVDLNSNITERWPMSQTDVPRLREGKVGGQFWSCYVSADIQYKDAVRVTLDQMDLIHRIIEQYHSTFKFVDSAQGIMDAFNDKKIASLIGIEGGHSIDSSLATLRMFYKLGARYMTLTHFISTPWADASPEDMKSGPGPHDGLSDFGKRVVLEMNRIGMAVDLSHVSRKTMLDAIKFSHAPVMFSHSGAYSLCAHHRNVHDDVLLKLKEKDGVVMVPFVNNYTNCNVQSNLSIIADHIDYIREVAGAKHVGIGSDFDGMGGLHPDGLDDVSKYPDLIAEMLRRGWSDADVRLLLGENLIRVLTGIENVRDILQRQYTKPDDHLINPEDIPDQNCRPDF